MLSIQESCEGFINSGWMWLFATLALPVPTSWAWFHPVAVLPELVPAPWPWLLTFSVLFFLLRCCPQVSRLPCSSLPPLYSSAQSQHSASPDSTFSVNAKVASTPGTVPFSSHLLGCSFVQTVEFFNQQILEVSNCYEISWKVRHPQCVLLIACPKKSHKPISTVNATASWSVNWADAILARPLLFAPSPELHALALAISELPPQGYPSICEVNLWTSLLTGTERLQSPLRTHPHLTSICPANTQLGHNRTSTAMCPKLRMLIPSQLYSHALCAKQPGSRHKKLGKKHGRFQRGKPTKVVACILTHPHVQPQNRCLRRSLRARRQISKGKAKNREGVTNSGEFSYSRALTMRGASRKRMVKP